jgi:transcriptional antiterminator RfaH
MAFWTCARLEPQREHVAMHFLGLNGYETYLPRLREYRRSHGRKIEVRPPLFPGYAFIAIELQWHAARWSPGVLGLIMDGTGPARVADSIIAGIRARERGGLVELAPPSGLRPGDSVRVTAGPFAGQLGLYAGMRPRERALVLLQLLGAAQRVELRRDDVEAV